MKDIVGGAAGTEEGAQGAPGTSQPAQPPRQRLTQNRINALLSEAREALERCELRAAQDGASQASDELIASWQHRIRELEAKLAEATRPTTRRDDRPRCGAKTRSGRPCQAPAAWDHRNNRPRSKNGRCRMHGGTNPGGGRPETRERLRQLAQHKPRLPNGRWIRVEKGENFREPSRETTPSEATLPDHAIIAEADQTSAA